MLGELKPEPTVLIEMLDVAGARPNEAIYIGDSLTKDVSLAQRVGVLDVYASYGSAHRREDYQRLVDITHWTDEDVRRERALREQDVCPSYAIQRFGQVVSILASHEAGHPSSALPAAAERPKV